MEEKDLEILGYLSIIKDPSLDRKKLHDLRNILFIGIWATLCGCDTWEDISLFAEERKGRKRSKTVIITSQFVIVRHNNGAVIWRFQNIRVSLFFVNCLQLTKNSNIPSEDNIY